MAPSPCCDTARAERCRSRNRLLAGNGLMTVARPRIGPPTLGRAPPGHTPTRRILAFASGAGRSHGMAANPTAPNPRTVEAATAAAAAEGRHADLWRTAWAKPARSVSGLRAGPVDCRRGSGEEPQEQRVHHARVLHGQGVRTWEHRKPPVRQRGRDGGPVLERHLVAVAPTTVSDSRSISGSVSSMCIVLA